ncbi:MULTISPECIES: hypothetical protein [unclassified Nocardia]|uniref:hypothetical protein n=1 Tax=unclassified Nocardia TaxID=2637762 RepID=UPI001CE46AC0|nr:MULTISPECIES: hypothetical protein [unclassified Nocardia]
MTDDYFDDEDDSIEDQLVRERTAAEQLAHRLGLLAKQIRHDLAKGTIPQAGEATKVAQVLDNTLQACSFLRHLSDPDH